MAAVLFFIAGIGVLTGAIGVIAVENPFYSVLALVGHLVSLAVLFLLLRAQFVAAAQVVVYAGAVMVLYVFVVSYVGGQEHTIGRPVGAAAKLGAWVFAAALAAELLIAVLGTGLSGIDSKGAPYISGFGTPAQIGKLLLTQFLAPFEIASFLLLIAAVGAVVLARRRGGEGGEADEGPVFSVLDIVRPAGTGTMAESAGLLGAVSAPGSQASRQLEHDRGGGHRAPAGDDKPPTAGRAGSPRGGW